MARHVFGTITDTNNAPVRGVRVRAWDEDSPSDDDLMGSATTNAAGEYRLSYHGGDWDLAVPGTTMWRPDIYVTVERPNGSSGFTRVGRSSTHHDHRLAADLRIDMQIAAVVQDEAHRIAAFDVARFGYHFVNSFVVRPELLGLDLGSWRMGFCGGMAAGAHHNFNTNTNAPADLHPPVEGTPLFDDLRARQVDSLSAGIIAKILEWQSSPDEPHTLAPHSMSFRTRQEWPRLYSRLRNNRPTSLVLIRVEGATADPSRNHQVLAYGYRWNPTTKDLELTVYDPNRPDQVVTLSMTLSGPRLRARDSSGERLRGFFVNPNGDAAAA